MYFVMREDQLKNQPLELAHALFRVAGQIKNAELKLKIESYSVHLLEKASLFDLESLNKFVYVLERLVLFGETIGEIPYSYTKIIYKQLGNMKSAIRQSNDHGIVEFDLSKIFKKDDVLLPDKQIVKEQVNGTTDTFVTGYSGSLVQNQSASERQTIILNKIRQSGNTAMRDIIAALPNVSERTLRYDLQKLCDRAVIERLGNGGPASFYRLRDLAAAPLIGVA